MMHSHTSIRRRNDTLLCLRGQGQSCQFARCQELAQGAKSRGHTFDKWATGTFSNSSRSCKLMICRSLASLGCKRMRLGAARDGFRLKEKIHFRLPATAERSTPCSTPRNLLYKPISRFLPESIEDAQARRVLAKPTDPCLASS